MTFLSLTRRPASAVLGPGRLHRIVSAAARPLRNRLVLALLPTEPRLPVGKRAKARAGQAFQPDAWDLGAWRLLIGRRVCFGYDLPEWNCGDVVPLVGVVRGFRIQDGLPLLVIDSGASRILIDPRWWRITVVDRRWPVLRAGISWVRSQLARSVSMYRRSARQARAAEEG